MHLIVAGLNHKTAPVEVRERCAFSAAHIREIYRELKGGGLFGGAMILTTCNRTELYASAKELDTGFALLEQVIGKHAAIDYCLLGGLLYRLADQRAVAHIFSVAAGLDSMVLGEHEILGQVKDAYRIAAEAQALDAPLNVLVQTAIHVGKKARYETGINRYPISVSAAAVELCRKIFGTLEGKTVLVVGAGDTGQRAVAALMHSGASSVIVSSRSFDHALQMARAVGGRAVHFNQIAHEIQAADIVISCTAAPHLVIRADNCAEALSRRNGREIVMIDIAVPRDIEPSLSSYQGVFLYDIDDLQNVVDRTHKERLQAAHNARAIIEQEALRFSERMISLPLVPVIAALKRYADEIAQYELEKFLPKIADAADSRRRASLATSLARSIAHRIIHLPIIQLKKKSIACQAHGYADMLSELFNLNNDGNENDQTAQTRNARQ